MNLEEYLTDHPEQRPYADLLVLPPEADEIRAEFRDADGDLVDRCLEAIKDCGFILSRGALYVILRRGGETDRWAAMCALNSPPIGATTDTFWAGRKHFSEVYGENYANWIKGLLKKQGVNLLPGQEYMPELALRPGDPAARVPFENARGYIKSVLQKRGMACEGAVTVAAREPESDPWEKRIPLAEDLVNESIGDMVADNPRLKKKKRAELREAVLAKHGLKH